MVPVLAARHITSSEAFVSNNKSRDRNNLELEENLESQPVLKIGDREETQSSSVNGLLVAGERLHCTELLKQSIVSAIPNFAIREVVQREVATTMCCISSI